MFILVPPITGESFIFWLNPDFGVFARNFNFGGFLIGYGVGE